MPRRKRMQESEMMRCESPDFDGQPPAQRNAANARERARMRVLSKAFCRLKTTLPWVPADTKLSKLDTLRLATSYIAHLRATLSADDAENNDLAANTDHHHHPLNLSWPFTFQHNVGTNASGSNNNNNNNNNNNGDTKNHHNHLRECSSPTILSEYSTSSTEHCEAFQSTMNMNNSGDNSYSINYHNNYHNNSATHYSNGHLNHDWQSSC
ncbi:probable serine/threonine-protein kinase DDB_G0282963 [Chrysoperla carnea]|uniref:probable serine/threonine-protein kinase DDB_G0282963 n=1 Tax=Chrysoperla carnea TaxID=189513 RepID=UPI001D06E924|nr:probable serine/threonine-protein kinase DDB_G0282963 [Chrysoperla carnea]